MGENGADIGPDDLETSPPRKPQIKPHVISDMKMAVILPQIGMK